MAQRRAQIVGDGITECLQLLVGRLQLIVESFGFQVQQADFEHVVNPDQYLWEIERFADEILRPGFERAQLVIRFGGNYEDWKIAARFDFLQTFHHLKAVHAGHLKIEQDQVVAVLVVKLPDRARLLRRGDGNIPGAAEHALEQKDVAFLIVNNQEFGVQNVRWTN